jgi:hypothetical protein
MNNPDHISESLETIFWIKIDGKKFGSGMEFGSRMEKIRTRDQGWKKFRSGIRDKHPGSATQPLVNDYFVN